MDGDERRRQIIEVLEASEGAVNATKLAQLFAVSRQIIVGDIALLRASGQEIVATSRGYLFSENGFEHGYVGKIACEHGFAETEQELRLIVALGGEVLDVVVEHAIYGELTGNLRIRTQSDIVAFMAPFSQSQLSLLSALTGGIHLHTIACRDSETFEKIRQALAKQDLLYQKS